MSAGAFRFNLALLAGALLLSSLAFPGAIIGLFFAFSLALIAGPLLVVTSTVLGIDDEWLLGSLASLYLLLVLTLGTRAWRALDSGLTDAARRSGFHAVLLAALPLIGVVSVRALADAWP